jgi:hypothetical protein
MKKHADISDRELGALIHNRSILWGGNSLKYSVSSKKKQASEYKIDPVNLQRVSAKTGNVYPDLYLE